MPYDDRSRSIGKIIYVTSDRLTVELYHGINNFTVVGFDDIHYVASLGSFVIIPLQSGYMVGEIVSLREKDPTNAATTDYTNTKLEKTRSIKYLDIIPVGTLSKNKSKRFSFGVSTFPSLYSDVLYALDKELDHIFDVADTKDTKSFPINDGEITGNQLKVLNIGSSVIFPGYEVKVKIDEYFAGHVAVLGNTGSGKSCTVASILQSLFEKSDEFKANGASFIIFDVNGEYWQALSQFPADISVKKINLVSGQVVTSDKKENTGEFKIPHWFLSVEEWELLLLASERSQRPVLRAALGIATYFAQGNDASNNKIKNYILASCLSHILRGEISGAAKADRIRALLANFSTEYINILTMEKFLVLKFGVLNLMSELLVFIEKYLEKNFSLPEHTLTKFNFNSMEESLELAILYEEAHGNRQIRDYCSNMLTRLKRIKERKDFNFLRASVDKVNKNHENINLYVEDLLGLKRQNNNLYKDNQIVIIDMNEASDEIVEVASAVLSRLIFDRLRSAEHRNSLPVHLILEEAHRYISQQSSKYSIDASMVFERIAKEGRKYGMFLNVASQRPSELSKTVLSQCSNFIIHRIQNPDDLSHIRQMTPYISESILSTLPSLPKQHALVFGNAVNLPTKFKVRNVSPMPRSEDAKIKDIWFVPAMQPVKWKTPSDK